LPYINPFKQKSLSGFVHALKNNRDRFESIAPLGKAVNCIGDQVVLALALRALSARIPIAKHFAETSEETATPRTAANMQILKFAYDLIRAWERLGPIPSSHYPHHGTTQADIDAHAPHYSHSQADIDAWAEKYGGQ